MQTTQFSKTKQAYERALSTIEHLTNNNDIPQALNLEIVDLLNKFKNYDITLHQEKGSLLTGAVLTAQEALKSVIDATGYNHWGLENLGEDGNTNEHMIKHLKENYGVDFDENEFQKYNISRKTNSRNDFWLVQVYAFAGHCWFTMDTGRADMCIARVLANEELTASIEANFN